MMKKATFLLLNLIIIPIFTAGQSIDNIDFISPFQDDVSAIKKDGKWAFINKDGNLIMDFRDDLVTSNTKDGEYPRFNDDRCSIVEVKAGISYFGFIDKSGKTVIDPQFLNSSEFNNGTAIALKVIKNVIAKNPALGKDMVKYEYFEVLIDTNGNIRYYLTQDGVNIVLDKGFLRTAPQITSRCISEHLYAVKNKQNSWNIINIKE